MTELFPVEVGDKTEYDDIEAGRCRLDVDDSEGEEIGSDITGAGESVEG